MADCLNAMTIGVQHESTVVVGVIVGPQPRRAIVATAGGERRRVKGVYRLAIGGAEAEMRQELGF
jgi:hypothetical protein